MAQVRDFEYQHLDNDDLLRLASDSKDLEPAAQEQLAAELKRRSISPSMQQQHEKETHLAQLQPGPRSWRGTGTRFFGKEFVRTEPGGPDVVRTTKFLTLFWIPVVPLGCYTISLSDPKQPFWTFDSQQVTALDKTANDWGMVIQTWLRAVAVLGLIYLAIKLAEKFVG